MKTKSIVKLFCAGLFGLLSSTGTNAQTFTVLKNFAGGSDGANPISGVIVSSNTLYGCSSVRVFKINTDGTEYTNYNSSGDCWDNLVLSSNTLYGSGLGGYGFVFNVNTDGTSYTMLMNFSNLTGNGTSPYGGLLLLSNRLYGTTYQGATTSPGGNGLVFALNTDGTNYTVLHRFVGGTNGANPRAGLTLSSNTLYGTTVVVIPTASTGYGTVFKVNTDGTGYTVLKNFASPTGAASDGATPSGGLTVSGSAIYGTTFSGGTNGYGVVFKLNMDGTGYTVLKNFSSSDGANPDFGKLALSGNMLYGTTKYGGASGNGTIFQINTDGTGFAVLKSFGSLINNTNSDGANPWAGVTLSGNTLYGTTYGGGTSGYGTIFTLTLPPPPSVTFVTTNGNFGFSNNQFVLQLVGSGGSNVVISASTNLQNWIPLVTNPLASGSISFTDTMAASFPQRFYRATLLP